MTDSHTITTPVGSLSVTDSGDGPATVMWHSLFVDDRSWDRLAEHLAGRRLIRITAPGHGDSKPIAGRYDMEMCATAAAEVLGALQVTEPVDWIGNAWGGHVGILLAASRPELIRSLAAFNAPVAALTRSQSRALRVLAAAFGLTGAIGPVRAAVASALLSDRTRATDPAAVRYVHDCLRSASRPALSTAIRSVSLSRPDLTAVLADVSSPALLVASDGDELWTADQARAAARLMPRGRSAVAIGTAHLTPFEAPAETARLLHEHWAASA